ncbi:N-alpha-acetyltransferase 60-like [Pollicipes pollicipes]|uniref:N-alpha-acetyltransferase 60-like n=1 Tax=Pollicipes pollicipes TaxID=41117 RepID=UPI0018859700|nr:N-alpha-acetyltransferase 60-like [Pollicipes pollicipes]XP_037080560.1 N-alpha-acetyltransferase 60-like [Pollicipes pollicipes]XP_037080561.1 N-alpha-acetyltransferase 60-like [Pollicipes pollicipes]XP_037080562.1 N-alpha-acetyltransferase 60-like [Pollicipes pollicipes]XP_037080563.1 N-alpha-acetyltransferase 60-like [Pollicipes pollicipes]XP_037080564.1 N-alpha-acetyltransferase 60-like [Pollicipes pollicipes]XP_037080565.1 N-alpha-acetyltransferase 60-like [Pollicipes pollicipes]XP_0
MNQHMWYPCDDTHDEVRVAMPVSPESRGAYEFRSLTPADIDTVRKLCKEWFPVEYPDSWFRDICTNSRFYTRVATYQTTIIGFIVAEVKIYALLTKEERSMLAASFPRRTQMAYILSLGVSAEYRRRGVASQLLGLLLNELRTAEHADCRAVYLHVLTSNSSALRFYERHKFRLHTFLPYFYKIDGKYRDGFLYVYYINGGHPSYGALDYVVYALSLAYDFSPCALLKHALRMAQRLVKYVVPQGKRVTETIACLS